MKKTVVIAVVTLAAFLAGVNLSAQVKQAWAWPDSMDAVAAAPEFHKAVFENDHIRLLEVTVNPGVTEKVHTHRYPSALVMDAPVPARAEFSGPTNTTATLPPRNEGIEWKTPQCVLFEPTPPHSLTNKGTYPIHFYRIEFKRMDGNELMKKTRY
jgi:hypothetical protein